MRFLFLVFNFKYPTNTQTQFWLVNMDDKQAFLAGQWPDVKRRTMEKVNKMATFLEKKPILETELGSIVRDVGNSQKKGSRRTVGLLSCINEFWRGPLQTT